MLIRDVIEKYSNILSEFSVTARLDVEILVCYVMGYNDKIKLMMSYNDEISDEKFLEFKRLFDLRVQKMPIAYIINNKEFMGLDFYVDENVLIPRPDTEVIVLETISILDNLCEMNKKSVTNDKCIDSTNSSTIDNLCVLDMCTGSGAIVISTAKHCSDFLNIDFYGVDISSEALKISKKNASNLGCDFIKFVESNLFESEYIKHLENSVDIIVSNPPYIEDDIIDTLEDDVKNYEPKLALSGGDDGMFFYNKIIEDSVRYLKDGGYLIFESGHDQASKISKKMKELGFVSIYTKKDIQGFDRAVIGTLNKNKN